MDAAIEFMPTDSGSAPTMERRLRTWHIFLAVAAGQVIVTWFLNEQVLTREVYHNLLNSQVDATRVDEYFDLTRRFNLWGYFLTPLLLLARIGFVALLVQLVLLLGVIEVPFKHVFRASLIAFTAVLYLSAIRAGWLALQDPADITQRLLSLTPLALSNFMDGSAYATPLHGLANMVSLFDLAWCVLFAEALWHSAPIRKGVALATVAGVWLVSTLFKWGLLTYLAKINA